MNTWNNRLIILKPKVAVIPLTWLIKIQCLIVVHRGIQQFNSNPTALQLQYLYTVYFNITIRTFLLEVIHLEL